MGDDRTAPSSEAQDHTGRTRSAPLGLGPIGPYARTLGYYGNAWRRYLGHHDSADLPIVRPTPALAAGAFVDEVVLSVFRNIRPSGASDLPRRSEDEIRRAVALYEESGWFDDPASFLVEPPALTDVKISAARHRRRPYEVLTFLSGYEPHEGEPGRNRWLGYRINRTVPAWVLRHPEPGPWLIAIHGTSMGRPAMDLTLLRAHQMHEELGLNVIMPVLPLHGLRGEGLPKGAAYPSEDVMDVVHGTAQAVWDIRRVVSWIRADQGADTPIGVTGISLGGFVTALVASVTDDLRCAILGVPVADIVDLLDRHAGPAPKQEQWRTVDLARRVATVVSPLAMEPKVPFSGRFIFAGLADRLVHPRHQVSRLWEHWGRPQINWYPSGHTGFFRSKAVQEFVPAALVQSGLIPDHGFG